MKIRILSLLTLVCIMLSALGFAAPHATYNKVKRSACLAGYSGCATVPVTLTLISSGSASVSKVIDHPDAGESYLVAYTKIKVTIGGRSSSGTYYLPTAVGDQVIIPATDGLTFGGNSYNVYIKKTADKEFSLSVSNSNL